MEFFLLERISRFLHRFFSLIPFSKIYPSFLKTANYKCSYLRHPFFPYAFNQSVTQLQL